LYGIRFVLGGGNKYSMKRLFFLAAIALMSLTSCKKTIQGIINKSLDKTNGLNQYSDYLIKKGAQSSTLSSYQKVEYDELRFMVKFDSSAIYQASNASNQYDVNKLFGFSDNNAEHQQYSARFGWNWTKEGLSMYAYTYNNTVRDIKRIGVVPIGSENACSIKVISDAYIFTLNGNSITMPRESTTLKALGYKLYPYFGGDELAPHDIHILIKEF
jgi:hypothetical protein